MIVSNKKANKGTQEFKTPTPPPVKKERPVGGPEPIIISGKEDQAGIALLTHDAAPRADLQKDYLFQVLKKLRTVSIFDSLLEQVAKVGPQSWAQLAADQLNLAPDQRSLPDEVLARLAKVPDETGIVVIDRAGFQDLEHDGDETWPKAVYNSLTHTIDLAQPETGDPLVVGREAGGYWQYLKNTLFELCNAYRRQALRRIEIQAAKGVLDCTTYTLSKELVEAASEELFDDLWRKAVKSLDCRADLLDEESGERLTLFADNGLLNGLYSQQVGVSRRDRMGNAVMTKHSAKYIDQWKDAYAGLHQSPAAKTPADQVEQATQGVTKMPVPEGMAAYFSNYVAGAYNSPDTYNMPAPPPLQPKKAQTSASGRTNKQQQKKKPLKK
ncbi:hypothetical protein [Nonomuraea sp. NPDC049480]|uniref:hypothetical protein n=1 Tax=Nonomuraea sp. NPDC049480 TaxID=3364353 RepID=UPI00379F1FEB